MGLQKRTKARKAGKDQPQSGSKWPQNIQSSPKLPGMLLLSLVSDNVGKLLSEKGHVY